MAYNHNDHLDTKLNKIIHVYQAKCMLIVIGVFLFKTSGLYHDGPSGRWRWVDGSELVLNKTSPWPWQNIPPAYTTEKNCAEVTYTGKWSSTDCRRNVSYVCEVQASESTFYSCQWHPERTKHQIFQELPHIPNFRNLESMCVLNWVTGAQRLMGYSIDRCALTSAFWLKSQNTCFDVPFYILYFSSDLIACHVI